jgi:predicted Zn finger-like uncharacterized protein
MAAPQTSQIVIECPNCGTRYRLPPEAIGPKGRQVACAHCGGTWQAKAEKPDRSDSDVLFDEDAEAALDEAFAAVERDTAEESAPEDEPAPMPDSAEAESRDASIAAIKAAIAPRTPRSADKKPVASDKKRQKAFDKRQRAILNSLPLARTRRGVRLVAVSALLLLIAGAVVFRTEIVRQFPDLAGAYEAVGLRVNVVGLELHDVTTLMTLRNGSNVMQVDARIFNVAGRRVRVPPVVVTLVDDSGAPLYEWSVAPEARELEAGEVTDVTTQLTAPPQGATRVRLAFTDGKAPASGAAPSSAASGR